jgi:hypothetical protein
MCSLLHSRRKPNSLLFQIILVMNSTANPRWVIDCRKCLVSFTHSEIGEARTLKDYLYPTKPEFPSGGQELECPSCKTKAIYMRHEVRYSTQVRS